MVKTKECYTKKRSAKNGGGSYTTCVEGQKKKTKKIKKIAVIRKKKKPAQKKMSAGKSVLMTSGLMNKIGAAVITKPEKKRRRIRGRREREKIQIKATAKLRSYITRIGSFRNKMIGNTLKGSSGSGTSSWEITNADASTKKKMIKKTKDMKKKYDNLKAEVDKVGSNFPGGFTDRMEADKYLKQILDALGKS